MTFYKLVLSIALSGLVTPIFLNNVKADDDIPDCASVGYDPLVKDSPLPSVEACKHGRNLIILGNSQPAANEPAKHASPAPRPLPDAKSPKTETFTFGNGTQF